MKNIQNYFFSTAFIMLFSLSSKSCSTSADVSTDCIDKSKITKGMCTADYDPVCGCDGKTYGNECEAGRSGVVKWIKGACPK